MSLFNCGDFKLSGGSHTKFKIDCDYLTGVDLKTLAFVAFRLLLPKRFTGVWGVPSGGLLFAKAMEGYASPGSRAGWLIVDDVLTTGNSMEKMKEQLGSNPNGETIGLVIFARGKCPSWITPIFQMPESAKEI